MADRIDATAGPGGRSLDGRWSAIHAEGLVKAHGETLTPDGPDRAVEVRRHRRKVDEPVCHLLSLASAVDDTIELSGLRDQAGALIGALSGGQKRRVDVALGIVGDPDLIFLWLADVGRVFPLYHVAVGVQTALGASADTSLRGGDVAVLVAWALAAVIVAARGFRWEPRAAAA
jgi:hypothetical protein